MPTLSYDQTHQELLFSPMKYIDGETNVAMSFNVKYKIANAFIVICIIMNLVTKYTNIKTMLYISVKKIITIKYVRLEMDLIKIDYMIHSYASL